MDNESKGIAWVGTMFQKFEDMCLEVDDVVRQEGLKYVEGQLQTVGANVKQFCSDFVRDVLSTSFEDTEEDSADKLSLVANDDMAKEISKDDIREDHIKKELSCSLGSVMDKGKDSILEENVDARKKLEVVSILEKWLEEKYAEHLMLDKIPFQKNNMGLSTVTTETDDAPGSSSSTYAKTNSIDVSSHKSVDLVDSCGSTMLDGGLISSGASAKSIGKQGNLMGDISNLGSSYEEKLDGSCIVVNSSELRYVSGEARSLSYQAFTKKEEDAKQGHDHDHGPAKFSNSNLGSIQQKEEGLAASSTVPSNDGSFESDWEIV